VPDSREQGAAIKDFREISNIDGWLDSERRQYAKKMAEDVGMEAYEKVRGHLDLITLNLPYETDDEFLEFARILIVRPIYLFYGVIGYIVRLATTYLIPRMILRSSKYHHCYCSLGYTLNNTIVYSRNDEETSTAERRIAIMEKEKEFEVKLVRFSENSARVVIAVVASAALLVPMITLTYVHPKKYRLLTVCISVILFSVGVAIASKAKVGELVGATAAYAAVLVVYVGSTSP
jgi:hypothetical protein